MCNRLKIKTIIIKTLRFWEFFRFFPSFFFFFFFFRLLNFFQSYFAKISFRNTIQVSNSLGPDLDQCSVGPDLGPYYQQMTSKGKVNY